MRLLVIRSCLWARLRAQGIVLNKKRKYSLSPDCGYAGHRPKHRDRQRRSSGTGGRV
jgi:hypothetical protein